MVKILQLEALIAQSSCC